MAFQIWPIGWLLIRAMPRLLRVTSTLTPPITFTTPAAVKVWCACCRRAVLPRRHWRTIRRWLAGSQFSFLLDTGLAGDFNGDGKVDAADYVSWRTGNSPNNGSIADYNTWRGNFGATAGSGSLAGGPAVPEPATFGAALVGLLGLVLSRRRR